MIKKDATEIQPKLVELQAAQEELDLQKTQLIAREIKMQGRGQVLEHRHEALDSRRERADFALEQNLGSVAVQVRRLIGTESVHPSQPRCSEELRSNKDGLPSILQSVVGRALFELVLDSAVQRSLRRRNQIRQEKAEYLTRI
jgi:hypothetical protein